MLSYVHSQGTILISESTVPMEIPFHPSHSLYLPSIPSHPLYVSFVLLFCPNHPLYMSSVLPSLSLSPPVHPLSPQVISCHPVYMSLSPQSPPSSSTRSLAARWSVVLTIHNHVSCHKSWKSNHPSVNLYVRYRLTLKCILLNRYNNALVVCISLQFMHLQNICIYSNFSLQFMHLQNISIYSNFVSLSLSFLIVYFSIIH